MLTTSRGALAGKTNLIETALRVDSEVDKRVELKQQLLRFKPGCENAVILPVCRKLGFYF